MITVAIVGILIGMAVYIGTAILMGIKKATYLPGGAIAGAILLSPWYIAVPAALVGHFLAVQLSKLVKR